MDKSLKRGFSVFLVLLMVFSSVPLTDSFADMVSNFAITASAMEATNETENNYDLVESSGRSRTMFASTASIDTPITPDDESNATKYGICEYFTGWYDGGVPGNVVRRNYAMRIVKVYPDGTFYGIGYVLPRSESGSTANGSYYLKGSIDFKNMTLSWQGYEWIKKISDSFEFLDFYNGSINESTNVLTGNTCHGDVTLTSDQNELNLIYNKLVNLTSDNNFRVIVKDGSGNLVSGAEVSLYDGNRWFGSAISNNGDAIFVGFDPSLNKKVTVSAHLPVGNGVELCSETVTSKGVWEGVKVESLGNNGILIVDEPRWYLQISVGYAGSTEEVREKRYKKIKSVFESYVQKFAEMTNGHCLITNVYITPYSSDTALLDNTHDFYILDDAPASIGRSITASTYSAKLGEGDYSGFMYEGFVIFDYKNGYFTDNTLCHESGHLFFGLWDEYCSGYGYDYDFDNDGIIDEGAGKWTTSQDGRVPRPVIDGKKAPSNFGVMDNEKSGNIELSNDSSYSYLYGVVYDPSHPEWYTKHYYEFQEPTEKTVANYLSNMAGGMTDYTTSNGSTQKAKYSYSKINIDDYSSSSDLINSKLEEIEKINTVKNNDSIIFDYDDSIIVGKYAESDNISVYIENVGDVEQIEISDREFFIPVPETSNRFIIVKDNEGLLSKEVYSVINDNGTIYIVSDTDITNGEYVSVDKTITILNLGTESYILSRSLISQDNFNYENTFWYYVDENDQYNKLDTNISYGEYTEIAYSSNVTSVGTYVLMSTPAVENSGSTISDFKVSNDTEGDGIVNISFSDSSDENEMYIIYYSMNPIEDIESEDVFSVTTYDSENITLYVDEQGKYYFAVQAKASDGSYTWYKNIATFNYKSNDSNKDGIPDVWFEDYYMLKDSTTIASEDTDEDGLTNLQEYELGTNPIDPDTDDDNVYDGVEVDNDLDPLKEKSNGVDIDYILLYGQPNLSVTSESIGISDEDFIFKVKNEAEGAALRTNIKIVSNGNILFAWEVNIRAYDEIEITAPISTLSSYDNFEIVIDENQITYDSDYVNNNLIVGVSDEFSLDCEEKTVVKNSTEKIVPIVTHNYCECFRFTSSNNKAVVVDDYGNLTAKGIGISTITITNMRGYTESFDVYVVAFEGAEYSEFDSKLINNSTEVAIIGYIGDDSSIVIPETIGSLPVTQLSSYAFEDCTFKEATIHSGINSIANTTFSDTTSLERIVVDEANTSYCSVDGILYTEDKTQLIKYPSAKTDTIFTIPETVTSIGAYSIKDCDYIEEITIPESVTSIGSSAIGNCNNLKKVNYNAVSSSAPSGFLGMYTTFYGSNAIEKVIIGDNVTVIPQYLFFGKSSLTEVVITENSKLSTIAQYAFYNCSKLANVFIPETVKTIGTCAFYGCSKLNGVTLPEALTSIGSSAFSGCSSLTSIKIPETVTSISDNTFANCTALEKVEIPYQITTIGETPFKGCSKAVIWCHNNSVAYEYAKANSIKYKVMEFDADDLVVTGLQDTFIDGLQYQLSAEIAPIYTDEKIVWSSSDSNVFTVSNSGLITAKGAGEAILTVASSRGSVSKTFNINVLGLSKDSENANLYHVRNADDMLTLSTMVNNGVSFAGKTIQLDSDIDFSNIAWTPIGIDSTNVFSGVFDGNNHKISGLNYATTSNTYSGLFGYIKTGGIKDLTVEGSVGGISRVGMIAGCIFDSALYNCKVIGEVKRIGSGSYGYVGGLVGSALHSVIINCAAETDITTDFGDSSINYAAVGGIVGAASTAGSDPMCILNSYCIGDISVSGNSYAYENYYVGGIAGYLKDDAANNYYFGEITNADGDTIKRIGYAFGYVVPEYTSESDYNGIGTIIVQDNYYLEGKNAIGLISEGDYDSSNWVSPISEENFSKLIGKGSLVDELNGNKSAVEEIIVAHRDILSNSTWAELVDRINGDSFTVSSWKIGSNNLPVNYECDCYRHAESEWIIDVEATCTKEGSKHNYCLVCQETVTTSIIEKAEHKFSDWTETKAATCTEKGSEYRTCTTCNSATETRDIAELGHNFVGEWTTDKAPTCTKSGVESRICTRCKSEKETRTVDKLGHDFESKWTVDKEATCSKVGSKSHHCSRCDEKSDVTVVNKIAHTYRESVQEATCTKDGKKTYNCSACGDSYSEVITAKGHIDQNGDGKCDNCDYIYDNTCDHMCHKSGFMGFVWKIVRFFWKLFKMNPVCECGVSHY